MAAFELQEPGDDARTTHAGRFSAWLRKMKSSSARMRWIAKSTTRYFTIDFDAQVFSYLQPGTGKSVSHSFFDILHVEQLPPDFGFLLRTQDRTYELHAASSADTSQWVYALRAAREYGKLGRGGDAGAKGPARAHDAALVHSRHVDVQVARLCAYTASRRRSALERLLRHCVPRGLRPSDWDTGGRSVSSGGKALRPGQCQKIALCDYSPKCAKASSWDAGRRAMQQAPVSVARSGLSASWASECSERGRDGGGWMQHGGAADEPGVPLLSYGKIPNALACNLYGARKPSPINIATRRLAARGPGKPARKCAAAPAPHAYQRAVMSPPYGRGAP